MFLSLSGRRGRSRSTTYNAPGKQIFLFHFNKKKKTHATLNPETFIDRRRGGGGKDRETKPDANGDPVHATDRSGGFGGEVRSQKISEFVINENKTGVCKSFLQNSAIICPWCVPVRRREGDGGEGRKEEGGIERGKWI